MWSSKDMDSELNTDQVSGPDLTSASSILMSNDVVKQPVARFNGCFPIKLQLVFKQQQPPWSFVEQLDDDEREAHSSFGLLILRG